MATHHHVLKCCHFSKQPDVLKRACNARLCHQMHIGRFIGLTCQFKASAVGRVKARDDVEESGFACAIGADQAIHLAAFNLHAYLGQGLQTTEAFGDARDVQHQVCTAHREPPCAFKVLPCSGVGHKPRGRHSMMVTIASAISNWRRMAASSRPSVMACKGPAT